MIDRRAPPGKFRVIEVDTFPVPPEEFLIEDFDSLVKALDAVKARGKEMNPVYCYDSSGRLCGKAGSF